MNDTEKADRYWYTKVRDGLYGEGGGKGAAGGSGGVPSEEPNTLQSKAVARFIDAWCEGEIKGLVAGAQSIYFDDTPLQNPDGSYNFQGVQFEYRVGTTDQTPLGGFPTAENEVAVGAQVKRFSSGKTWDAEEVDPAANSVVSLGHGLSTEDGPYKLQTNGTLPPPLTETTSYWIIRVDNDKIKFATSQANAAAGTAVDLTDKGEGKSQVGIEAGGTIRQLTDPDIDVVKLTLRVPQLSYQDPETGNLGPDTINFKIEVQPNAGSYAPVVAFYEWQDLAVPGSGPVTTPDKSQAVEVTAQYAPANNKSGAEAWSMRAQYRAVGGGGWTTFASDFGQMKNDAKYRTNRNGGTVYENVSRTFVVDGLALNDYEVQVIIYNVTIPGSSTPVTPPGTISLSAARARVENGNARISGKTVSPYEEQYRVPLPVGGAPWNIRVTRTTADSLETNRQNDLFWSSYTEVKEAKLMYPDTALIGTAVDSQLFGGNVPRRSYEVNLRKVQIPSNYDPYSKTYNGVWDGTFVVDWTDNPAWVLYDVLINRRVGIGEFIDATQVDKWSLYSIGVYCDGLVPDGVGGTETRFTFNYLFQEAKDAYTVVQSIAAAFRGMAYWSSGAITVSQDSPADPVKLVVPANVINGEFNYSGSGLKARHSVAMVTWNDPSDGYRAAIEPVEDPELMEKYGYRDFQVTAMGTTSRSQARRYGRWILDSEKSEKDTVTYRCSFDHADLMPGQIIEIADPDYQGFRMGGRVAAATTTVIDIDGSVVIETGQTYTLTCVKPDGTLMSSAVTNVPEETTSLTVSPAFTATPLVNSIWLLLASNLMPRKFRVLSLVELEKNEFQVMALVHDETKFARVEEGVDLQAGQYTLIPTGPLLEPTSLQFKEYLYQAGIAKKAAVTLSWAQSLDGRTQRYEVQVRPPGSLGFYSVGTTNGLNFDVLDVQAGGWGFRVRAVQAIGAPSHWLTIDPQNILGITGPPGDVTGLEVAVVDASVELTWDHVTDLDLSHYEIRFTSELSTPVWSGSVVMATNIKSNHVDLPAMPGTYMVKAVDESNVYSLVAATVVSSTEYLWQMNVIQTYTEEPGWAGTKSGTVKDGNNLKLDSDAYGFLASGTYTLSSTLDLGQVYTSRISMELKVTGLDSNNTMSAWTTLASVLTLSGVIDPGDYEVLIQLRKTNDDPAGAPTWTAWENFSVCDCTARGLQFRLILYSFKKNISPLVTLFHVTVDMPDRVVGAGGLSVGAGGSTVSFAPDFKATPVIVVMIVSPTQGDYFVVSNQTRTGFDIDCYDVSTTQVARTVNWIAKGYGAEV